MEDKASCVSKSAICPGGNPVEGTTESEGDFLPGTPASCGRLFRKIPENDGSEQGKRGESYQGNIDVNFLTRLLVLSFHHYRRI